jgi:WD40 repeat protein
VLLVACPGGPEEAAPTWTELRRLPIEFDLPGDGRVSSLVTAGPVLLVGGNGGLCGLNGETGERLWCVRPGPTVIAAFPDGDRLACAFDKPTEAGDFRVRLEIRDTATGRLRDTVGTYGTSGGGTNVPFGATCCLTGIAVHPSGEHLTVAAASSVVTWSHGEAGWAHGPVVRDTVSDLAYGPTGSTVIAPRTWARKLVWRDLDGNQIRTTRSRGMPARLDVAGRTFAYCTVPGTVHLADSVTGAEVLRLQPRIGPTNDIAVSPDGAYVFAVGNLGVLHAWEAATGRVVGRIRLDSRANVLAVAGNRLYVGGEHLALFAWR